MFLHILNDDFLLLYFQPEFDWDSKTIGMIQSIFAYGYLFCVAGAYLVGKFGGAVTCGVSLMSMAILTILTPASLQTSFYLYAGLRVMIGILDVSIKYLFALKLAQFGVILKHP